jgi:hypothetical protein
MRNFRPNISVIYWLSIVLVFTAVGCKKKNLNPGTMNPSGMLVDYLDCGATENPSQDCVVYQYDGQSVLLLQHRNAAFNCCHGEITADITFNNNTIRIKEKEAFSLCDCACLVPQLNYKIIDLEPGVYTIIVDGLYRSGGERSLEFVVNFSAANSGIHCIERNHYPWPH